MPCTPESWGIDIPANLHVQVVFAGVVTAVVLGVTVFATAYVVNKVTLASTREINVGSNSLSSEIETNATSQPLVEVEVKLHDESPDSATNSPPDPLVSYRDLFPYMCRERDADLLSEEGRGQPTMPYPEAPPTPPTLPTPSSMTDDYVARSLLITDEDSGTYGWVKTLSVIVLILVGYSFLLLIFCRCYRPFRLVIRKIVGPSVRQDKEVDNEVDDGVYGQPRPPSTIPEFFAELKQTVVTQSALTRNLISGVAHDVSTMRNDLPNRFTDMESRLSGVIVTNGLYSESMQPTNVPQLLSDLQAAVVEVLGIREHLSTLETRLSALIAINGIFSESLPTFNIPDSVSDLRSTVVQQLNQTDSQITTVVGDLSGLRNEISGLQTGFSAFASRLAEVESNNTLQSDIGSLREGLDSQTEALRTVKDTIRGVVQSTMDISSNLGAVVAATDFSDGYSLSRTLGNVQVEVSSLSDALRNVRGEVSGLSANVTGAIVRQHTDVTRHLMEMKGDIEQLVERPAPVAFPGMNSNWRPGPPLPPPSWVGQGAGPSMYATQGPYS